MSLATDIIESGFKDGPTAQNAAQVDALDLAAGHLVLAARLIEGRGTLTAAELVEKLTPAMLELSGVVKAVAEQTRRAVLLKAKVAQQQAERAPAASVIQRGEDHTADLLRQAQGL